MASEKPHHRIWPVVSFNRMPKVDDFITRGDHHNPERRWWVDTKPFPNLTQARMHVADTLGIDLSQVEIASDVSFNTPARKPKMTNPDQTSSTAQSPTAAAAVGAEPAPATKRVARTPSNKGAQKPPALPTRQCMINVTVTLPDGSVMTINTPDAEYAIRVIKTSTDL